MSETPISRFSPEAWRLLENDPDLARRVHNITKTMLRTIKQIFDLEKEMGRSYSEERSLSAREICDSIYAYIERVLTGNDNQETPNPMGR